MLNNLTNFYSIIRGRMLRNSRTIEKSDIIPLGVVNPNYGGGYAPSAITVGELSTMFPTPPTPTLQEVSNTGGLTNNSTIRQGTVDRFGLNGISRICSAGYEIQFVNGVEYYLTGVGGQILQAISSNGLAPDASYDDIQGFIRGSIYIDLKSNLSYICINASTSSAEWMRMAGEYTPTLDGESSAVTRVRFNNAFYSINNGMVECIIYGIVDLDFTIDSKGNFKFTIPFPSITKANGSISINTVEQVNGIVLEGVATFLSRGGSIETNVPFVAKFTYQAW